MTRPFRNGLELLTFLLGQEVEHIVFTTVQLLGGQTVACWRFLEPKRQFSGIHFLNGDCKVDPTDRFRSGVIVLVVTSEEKALMALVHDHQPRHSLMFHFPWLLILLAVDVEPGTGDDARPVLQTRKDAVPRVKDTFHLAVFIQPMNRAVIEPKDSTPRRHRRGEQSLT